jgi:hypothetical protein
MRKIALAVALILAAGAAQAQGPSAGQPGGQGQMTPEQRFNNMDANRDGYLTKQEFMAQAEQRWAQMLQHMDANRDGNISREEFLAAPRPGANGQGTQPAPR